MVFYEREEDAIKDPTGDADVTIKGMFRVNIVDDKAEIVGDSGWKKNVVAKVGIRDMLYRISNDQNTDNNIGVDEGPWGLFLGTGGDVSYSDTQLPGSIDILDEITAMVYHTVAGATDAGVVQISTYVSSDAASNSYQTYAVMATYNSNWNTIAYDISNVGLYNEDGPDGTMFYAGNNFSSTNCATNQAVQITYNILLGGQ